MDLALTGRRARAKSAELGAVGVPALAAVGAGGVSLGFFLWYALALRGPHSGAYLDVALIAGLAVGLLAAYSGWIGYAHYFAHRAHVDELTALQADAISWAPLVLLWATLLPPAGRAGTGLAAALTGSGFVLAKLVVAARFNQTVRDVALTFIVTRLPLLATAELAAAVIGQRPGIHYAASTNPLLAVWGRWDAEHYLGIAQQGYSGTEPAFFPLYPALIRLVGAVTGSHLLAGLLISNAASFLALLYLYKLIEHEYTRQVAHRTTFYVSIFPTAIFFSAVYSESLFLFLTVASFYYLRRRSWLIAGVFGFFAALTRSEGALLVAPFAIEWIVAAWEGRREFLRYWWSDIVVPAVSMALVPLGLAVYMAYLWVLRGDPLLFSHVQRHWGRHLAWPWTSVWKTLMKIVHAHSPQTIANQSLELAFTLLMIVVLLVGLRRLRLSYTVYMAASILAPMSTSSLMSMPRFALVLFPMFALLGLWGGRPGVHNAIVAFSLPLLGLFTVLFADWYWVA
ncbi:MAG: glycosyltransferase family 39 protein [Candidatus Eremiobacteraeota bacterium]|nr:glycosyltransferase family 39 protein [Candidatus Eremiobacteraeota bacterium]